MKATLPVARDRVTAGHGTATRATPPDRTAARRALVTHDHASIALYVGGRARLEQNGQWTLREGDVLLLPAGQPHRMLELSGAAYWDLPLHVPSVPADDAATLLAPLERVRDGASCVVSIPASRQAFLEGLFRELAEVGSAPQAKAHEAVRRSLVTLILAEIEKAASPSAVQPTSPGVVTESLRFIERNCLRRLTLDEIAAAVGRSPTYVTAALTEATGRSAGAWILSGRMAEARRLLARSDEHIDVIAERVGYADPTHFIRMFRRVHGATPAAWRASR